MNEQDLQQQLQQPTPTPDATTKARHMAAALAAFQAEHNAAPAPASESANPAQKKPTLIQGFLQRLRLTRDTNYHGSKSMSTSQPDHPQHAHPQQDPRPLWQKPMLVSGIAASSLAVLAGLTFIQYLAVLPADQSLADLEQSPGVRLVIQDAAPESNEAAPALKKEQPEWRLEEEAAYVAAEAPPSRAMQPMVAAAPKAELAKPAPSLQALSVTERLATEPPTQMPREFRDRFQDFNENPVIAVSEKPVSTFSVDVDTASYSFVRRMLNNGQLPPKDAVRSEEMINYFDYAYPSPRNRNTPFATHVSVVESPWKKGNQLIHIGIQGYQLPAGEIPQSNLVFLLDVSGSMDEPSKLPLVKQSMGLLLDSLKPDDTVAIAVYAGAAGTVLEPTKVKEKQKILAALNNLQAGGSTAGAEGIALAYQLAEANFNAKGVNRVILATDGDFNVGQTSDNALQDLVERKREKGIYLSVLGFGQGNYQDAMMQTLAQHGNGTAAYIDTLGEAQKVLVNEATSTLFPIAKDVKIQVEFNPAAVAEYRLVGYETRALNREDFNNDKVDAGEIGSGHRVTAIYEITPVGAQGKLLEPSRYQSAQALTAGGTAGELAFLRLRYKLPRENQSRLIETPIETRLLEAKPEFQQEINFSIAVAGFAQLLRGSNYLDDYSYDRVIELAQANKGKDDYGYRTEFIQLVRKAKIAREY